jgi:hypothetical protein
VPKHPLERALVAPDHAVEETRLAAGVARERPEQARAHHRRRRQRDRQGHRDGDRQRHGELAEEPSDDPPIRRIGMKTATSDTLIDITVKPISRAPRRAASSGARPDSTCRVMFSIDDDRVVHDEPGRDRQRHQRQVVDAVAAAGTSPRTSRSGRPAPRRSG